MSLRKLLGRILLFGMLEMGALMGVPMTPDDIEKLLNVMRRTRVERCLGVRRQRRRFD